MTTLTANINTATSTLLNKVFPIISWKSIAIISLFLAHLQSFIPPIPRAMLLQNYKMSVNSMTIYLWNGPNYY